MNDVTVYADAVTSHTANATANIEAGTAHTAHDTIKPPFEPTATAHAKMSKQFLFAHENIILTKISSNHLLIPWNTYYLNIIIRKGCLLPRIQIDYYLKGVMLPRNHIDYYSKGGLLSRINIDY